MSLRLKAVFGFLILIIVFLGFRFTNFVDGVFSLSSISSQSSATIFSPISIFDADRDRDGIPDSLESRNNTDSFLADTDGDGFLDGEELLSGCAPTAKSPGDCIKRSIARETTQIIIGGIQSGTLGIGEIQDLSDFAVSEFDARIENSYSKVLTTIDPRSTEDIYAYVYNVKDALSTSIGLPKKELKSLFSQAITKAIKNPYQENSELQKIEKIFLDSYSGISSIPVPKTWENWHEEVRRDLFLVSQTAKLLNNPDDPFSQGLSIKRMQESLDNLSFLLSSLEEVTGPLTAIGDFIPGLPSVPGLPSIPGLPGLPGTSACAGDACVPVHVKQDDPFTDARNEDIEERKAAKEVLEFMLKELGTTVKQGAQSASCAEGSSNIATCKKVPTFVTNYRTYRQEHADLGASRARLIVGSALLGSIENPERAVACPYYADSVAKALGATAPTERFIREQLPKYRSGDLAFHDIAKCTLRDDFDYEGYLSGETFTWEDFEEIAENPTGNTPLGFYAAAVEFIEVQRAIEAGFAQQEVSDNNGGIGRRDENGNIVTPGSFYVSANNNILEAQLEWIISSDNKGELNGDGEVARTGTPGIPNIPGVPGGGVSCGSSLFPLQLFDRYLKEFTGSSLCDFLAIINAIETIIDSLPS